jgi:hypothetical protein
VLLFHSKVLALFTAIENEPQVIGANSSRLGIELFPHMISSGKALQGLMQLTLHNLPVSFDYLGQ